MRTASQLRVPLRASRTLAIALPALALAAFASWTSIGAPLWADVAVWLAVTLWACFAVVTHALRLSSRSIVELLLAEDAILVVRTRAGRLRAGHVRTASFVHPWLTTIVWRPDGAQCSRSMVVVPDMLDVDDFRRLRVLLRYGRREVDAGAPASQA